nr:hypothetical protein [Tanacetum cinerariifolium]
MIAILEKSEHNVDFHQTVDFVKASHIRYALTINLTVYVSYIRQFWSTARIETTNEGTKILATVDGKPKSISESSIRRNLKLNDEEGIGTLSDAELFENLALKGYNILPNQKFTFQKGSVFPSVEVSHPYHYSKALPTATDKPASLLRDVSQGEAFPTLSGLEAGQDRENIIKTSALPHDSTPRVTSLDADEGNLEISNLKAKIKLLEDKDKGSAELSGDDAPIKGRNVSVPPAAGVSTIGVPTVSRLVPTVSAIFTTASVVTPYSRCSREILAKDKGKTKMVESDTPKKKKLQEQIDVQVAREIEEEMAREDQRMNEQIARDAEIARIHAEEELMMLIYGLDRSNEMTAKHLHEYEQAAAELTIGEKIELINELVKYQDHHANILKYQAQQSITLEEIREKFIPVWKQIEDFVPMSSKEKAKRFKMKGLRLEQGSARRMKTSNDVSEEDIKEMMQLVPVKEARRHTAVYQFFVDMLKQFEREDVNRLWTLVKETLSIRQVSSDKEKELWVELKRLFKPEFEEQLWTHTQNLMHDPLEWRLYDTCGVHHVFTKDQECWDFTLRGDIDGITISYHSIIHKG